LTVFEKIHKCKISRKPIDWEPSFSMQANGWADMTKLNSCFSQFCDTHLKTVCIVFLG